MTPELLRFRCSHTSPAEVVRDNEYSKGAFLDGAALAAQELGRKDLPARLERAWRQAPSMLRLRRWLGSADEREDAARAGLVGARGLSEASRAAACTYTYCSMTSLLPPSSRAPGLGWSNGERASRAPALSPLHRHADANTVRPERRLRRRRTQFLCRSRRTTAHHTGDRDANQRGWRGGFRRKGEFTQTFLA
jgi:hypothetical protein